MEEEELNVEAPQEMIDTPQDDAQVAAGAIDATMLQRNDGWVMDEQQGFRDSPMQCNTEVMGVHRRIDSLIYHIDKLEERIYDLESEKSDMQETIDDLEDRIVGLE